jgi:hypothetical protein
MSNGPNEHPNDGSADRPDGSIDDGSAHPSTEPDDPGTADPAAHLGNASTDADKDLGEDARLMGPAGN